MRAVESLEKEERRIRLLWIFMLLILILTKYATQYAFGEKIGAVYQNKEFHQLADEIVIACEISIIIFMVEERIRRTHHRLLLTLKQRRVTNLYIDRKKKAFWFSKKIGVPGSGTIDVYIKTDEVLPLAQRRNVYVQLRPSVNLYLSISNAYRERIREIGFPDLNHRSGIFTADHEASYRYEGGILPGQSFDVNWELTDD